MVELKSRFDFPTKTSDAVEMYRLLADAHDRADGLDQVNEKRHIDRGYAEDLWRRAQTPTIRQLVNAAAGKRAHHQHKKIGETSPVLMSVKHRQREATWADIRDALAGVEQAGGLNEAGITAALRALGLRRDPAAEGEVGAMVFSQGETRVGLRLYQLGPIRAVEIAVAGKKDADAPGGNDFERLERGTAGTYVAGTLIEPKHWKLIFEEFVETLELARDALAAAANSGRRPRLPVEFAALKRLIASGADKDERVDEAHETTEVKVQQKEITRLWRKMVTEGTAPAGVLLQFDGPDGAGKTSSVQHLVEALVAANHSLPRGQRWRTRTEIFKGPTDQDLAWQKQGAGKDSGLPVSQWRHLMRGIPPRHTIMVKDRFQASDHAYGKEQGPEALAQRTGEYGQFEALLQERDILSFKAVLYAGKKKQSKTFGKRMARGAFADALIEELRSRGDLTPAVHKKLNAVKAKIEGSDLRALANFDEVLPRFLEFAAAAGDRVPFVVHDTDDRHGTHLQLLADLHEALKAHRAQALERRRADG